MYCYQCGAKLEENTRYCIACGAQSSSGNKPEKEEAETEKRNLVGYSSRISDPAFGKYIGNYNRWSSIFAVVLAFAAVFGFTVAGSLGVEGIGNPQGLFIGLAIGGMFLLIAFIQIAKKKKDTTWEGTVADKSTEKKRKRKQSGDDDVWITSTEFTVMIKDDNGKKHVIKRENNAALYNYYQIGDRVKHHAGLSLYEKYDKSKDSMIYCVACGNFDSIQQETCSRCKCPLLK